MRKETALHLLRKATNNPFAKFREGQWEAIDGIVNHSQKLLVVQRTGWGKSLVYFLSAKALRDQNKGITIIISPLLALMRNQIESAKRLGVRAISINSTNYADWNNSKQLVLNSKVDALLISPERLANEKFMEEILRPIANNVGLFVVDEAHCISDWGHDFRPDYRRIVRILQFLPPGLPILGTTATANNRVCEDIKKQLGNIEIIRGRLTRESLILQNISMNSQVSRLAWLKENLPRIDGNGIIYVLTKRDTHIVTNWLVLCGINAAYYYSGAENDKFENSTSYREYLEDAFYKNQIKVLVATSALGMGYDKPDLSFVIHYQAPGSIINYYQQVGRAGRAIDFAYGVLLSGKEDDDIHAYFRQSAFPPKERVQLILNELEHSDGLTVPKLMSRLNLRKGQIEQVLKHLQVEATSPVIKIGSQWHRTAVSFTMDSKKIERLTKQRVTEWNEVQAYLKFEKCLMNFLQLALDDFPEKECGKCFRCIPRNGFPRNVSHSSEVQAATFLKRSDFEIELRKRIESDSLESYGIRNGNLAKELRAKKGRSLSRWGDAGWGRMVAEDKHNNHFRDELVDAFVEMITQRWKPQPRPTWVTCIPSLRRPNLVPSFSKRVASKLGIPFIPSIIKVRETPPQKQQENSYFQAKNLDGAFQINSLRINEPVLLIDDAIDSRWTLTIAAILLRRAGSGDVFPAVLTSTAPD